MEGIYIGLDAGASKTELVAENESGKELVTLFGPPANMARLGKAKSARILARLVREAIDTLPEMEIKSLCAGVAGATGPREQKDLANELRQQLKKLAPSQLLVVHDGEISLEAAFTGGSGIIIAIGTGSIVLARTVEGTSLRAGGWGYLLGDEGSGYQIGLQGLRAVTRALDGDAPTLLQSLLKENFHIGTQPQLTRAVYRDEFQVQYFAPFVIEAAESGDEASRKILTEQARALAYQATLISRRGHAITKRIALLGGLAMNNLYRNFLINALNRELPEWEILHSNIRPVRGAVFLARSRSSETR